MTEKMSYPNFLLTEILNTVKRREASKTSADDSLKWYCCPKNGIVDISKGGDSQIKTITLSPKTIQHRISKDASGQI